MVEVVIAEDNETVSIHLLNVINSTKEVYALSILNNGMDVYKTLKELKPSILVLDLKLPGKDGIEILKEIENDSDLDVRVVVYSGAPEYITKIIGFKSVDMFFDKMHSCEEIGMEVIRIARNISDQKLEKRIKNSLIKIGFKPEHKGTKYIKECIKISIKENVETLEMIYNNIAKTNGKKSGTIKADVQGAINKMWKATDKEKTRKMLRLGENESPSPSNVVSMIKYYIQE